MPFLAKTIDPKEIVTKAREYTLPSFEENCTTNSDPALTASTASHLPISGPMPAC